MVKRNTHLQEFGYYDDIKYLLNQKNKCIIILSVICVSI
jgi:hypothetical protein